MTLYSLCKTILSKNTRYCDKAQTGDYHIRFDDWVDDMAADELSFGEESANTPHIKSSDRSELEVDQMATKILSLIKNCQAQTVYRLSGYTSAAQHGQKHHSWQRLYRQSLIFCVCPCILNTRSIMPSKIMIWSKHPC